MTRPEDELEQLEGDLARAVAAGDTREAALCRRAIRDLCREVDERDHPEDYPPAPRYEPHE